MENVINFMHCAPHGFKISYITDIEFDFISNIRHLSLKFVAHIVLLLFITGKDTNFTDIGSEKSV